MALRGRLFRHPRQWLNTDHSALPGDLDEYLEYVAAVGFQLGELSPLPDETIAGIRAMVQTAARSLGLRTRTWSDEGKVYFYVIR